MHFSLLLTRNEQTSARQRGGETSQGRDLKSINGPRRAEHAIRGRLAPGVHSS